MTQIQKIKIQDSIVQNRDSYSWSEVNCFYKPWAIAHAANDPSYFDYYLFLISFYQTNIIDRMMRDVNISLHSYYDEVYRVYNTRMSTLFGMNIHVERGLKTEEDLNKYVIEQINNNHRVIVPIELHNLYYYENYRKSNLQHFLIMKGYDKDRDLYYILDTTQNKSGLRPIYTDFYMPFNLFSDLSRDYLEKYTETFNGYEVWTLKKNVSYRRISVFDVMKFYYNEILRIEEGLSTTENIEEYLLNILSNETSNESFPFRERDIYLKFNMRIVHYDKLIQFLEQISFSKMEEIINLKTCFLEKCSSILNLITYTNLKKNKNFSKCFAAASEIKEIERSMRKLIIDNFPEGAVDQSIALSISNNVFFEKNNNNALIKRENNDITMIHSKDEIYNTWISQDDAAQVLLDVGSNKNFSLNTHISFSTSVGREFHVGIICKFDNGNKLLFGNIAGDKLTVYCPEVSNKYLKEIALDYNFIDIAIQKQDSVISLRYKYNDEKIWNNFLDIPVDASVNSFGIFSKTWMAIDHSATFSNVEYSFSN